MIDLRNRFNLSGKDFNVVIGLVALPLVLSVLLLVLVFRPSPGDDQLLSDINKYPLLGSHTITKEEFLKAVETVQTITTTETSNQYGEISVDSLKYNSAIPPNSQGIDTMLYKIASYYYNSTLDTNIPADQIDPLFLLATTNLELGSYNESNYSFSPVIPTEYAKRITADDVKTFGIGNLVNDAGYWRGQSPSYLGPFQMSPYWGMEHPIKPSDLKSNEETRIAAAWGTKPLPVYLVNYPIESGYLNSGDRFNWADECNRVSGDLNYFYGRYLKASSSKTGDEEIATKYQLMCLQYMAINAGDYLVMNTADTDNMDLVYNEWGPGINIRRYAHDVGSQKSVDYINTKVKADLQSARAGNSSPSIILNTDSALKYVSDLESQGVIHSDELKPTDTSYHKEKAAGPIKIIYAYLMLSSLYSGN